MAEILTNEFISYKTGFIKGKGDIIEFIKIGIPMEKRFPLENLEYKL